MDRRQLLLSRREEVLRLAAAHGARRVRLFGSLARGEGREGSDVDLLVEMEEGRTLLDLGGLQQALEELLGLPVDLVTERSLPPRVRRQVLAEAIPL
jgi:predicted nucleotidyltransferase